MTALDPRAHDQGVIAALETVGRPVGYVEAPDHALDNLLNRALPDAQRLGYYVVHPVDGGGRDGTAAVPDELAVIPYRIHCVDRNADGAAWLAARAEEALAAMAVADRHVMRVEPVTRGSVTRDPDEPRVFTAAPLYHIHTSPS